MVVFGYETLDTINNRDGNMATTIQRKAIFPASLQEEVGLEMSKT